MKKPFLLTFALILITFVSANAQSDCRFWFAKVDPKVKNINYKIDVKDSLNLIEGIGCLLTLEGKKELGLRKGNTRVDVSQLFPEASVEINALYQISELFYGNSDFASAMALIGKRGNREFNSTLDVKKAFASYHRWFEKVQKIGLDEARKQKLDPLKNSGVRWY